ncbi:hypothetical protein [Sphingobium phenoxybenzoativorans]|uniref:hypothetical protein n=1 Tax=Sphingobium phenoxybenzoativorans TaxID=1592790 RepID=UPI000872B9BC|nr:hypothetical protein [Sphingobium phenoxybenzoativorans]
MHLLRTIERFLKETGMPATRFGREAVRDPRLVLDMRNGREPGERMKNRVERFMNKYQSEGAR